MATVVKMPKWGLTMTVGTVTDWLIEEGAEVAEGDPLFTVETEKAVNDVEAPSAGTIVKIVANQGDEVAVSNAVAILAAPGEILSADEIEALVGSAMTTQDMPVGTTIQSGSARTVRVAARGEGGRVNASPAARRLAGELGIDLETVDATGPDGRITSEDVELAAANVAVDPTPREELITLADERTLNALFAGAGPGLPLVFLHGLGGSQSTWQVVLSDLVDQHQTCSIDLPGHGLSDKAIDADYTIAGLADAITQAITALKLTRPILVGHSLGGAVALRIAATGTVAGVVAIDSAGLGTDASERLSALMAGNHGAETARWLLELFYRDQKLVNDRGVNEMAAAQSAEGTWPAQQLVATAAFDGGLQRDALRVDPGTIHVPVLLIWGEDDQVLPVAHGYDAVGRFADAQLAVLSETGHVPQVENATRTARLIGRFAKSIA
jgi:pimeloyl-ACP methyl ester carboxylesterase